MTVRPRRQSVQRALNNKRTQMKQFRRHRPWQRPLLAEWLEPRRVLAGEVPLPYEMALISHGAASQSEALPMEFQGSGGDSLAPAVSTSFDVINFDEDAANTGFYHIPPDPHGAVGTNHVVAVVNTSIEWHTKSGTQQNSQRLGKNGSTAVGSFFASLNPVNSLFDPKVIYDSLSNRFIVVALEKTDDQDGNNTGDADDTSRILIAASDDADPNGTWHYLAINGKTTIGATDTWADYPGFAFDEEAIYVTNNQFTFGSPNSFLGTRLWIINKSQLYSGAAATVTIHDPSTSAGLPGQAFTLQPASMYQAGSGAVGTFLVSTDWVSGSNEIASIIRVDNPLTSPSFSNQFVSFGDLQPTFPTFPNAPQSGSAININTGSQRAMNAVWRNDNLYFVNTILPGSGVNANQETAHWYRVNTSNLATLTLADQGNVDGEDIATGVRTFYPSVAVNSNGDMAVGFAASGPTIFPGAYYTVRRASDPAGTVQSAGTLAAGLDTYVRTFTAGSTGRNRWGDYSATVWDATNDGFWVFNEYAMTQGTTFTGESGRWATRWGQFSLGTLTASVTGGNLTVTDSDSTGKANNFVLKIAGGNLSLSDATEQFQSAPVGWTLSGDAKSISIPVGNFSGSITINGAGGGDLLTIDYVGGNPITAGGLSYNGGLGADSLALKGTGTEAATYRPSDVAGTNGNKGTILVGGSTIAFDGLAPVDMASLASVTVDPAGTIDVLTVATGQNLTSGIVPAASQAALLVSGTTGGLAIENLALWSVGTLTVNTAVTGGQDGGDTITVSGANGAAAAVNNLTISTGTTGTDSISITGTISIGGAVSMTANGSIGATGSGAIASTGSITLTAVGASSDITLNGGTVTSSGGNIALNADRTVTISKNVSTTGAGTISVSGNSNQGARNVLVNSSAVVSTVNGDISFDADQSIVTGTFAGIDISSATISTSGSGSIFLIGQGGNGANNQAGVLLQGGSAITITGSGSLTIDGKGRSGSIGANSDGVRLASVAITSGTSGNVSITGRRGANTNEGVALISPSSINTASSTGQLTIATDTFDYPTAGTFAINAAGRTVTFRQLTDGTSLDLGTASTTSWGLSDTNLDRITAGLLQIGDANSGPVTVSASITHPNSLAVSSAGNIAVNQSITLDNNKSLSLSAGADLSIASGVTMATGGSGGANLVASGGIAMSSSATVLVASADISVTSGTGISFASNASLTSSNGNITVNANPAGNGGSFHGLSLDLSANITASNGSATIAGRGAGSNQDGIRLSNSSQITAKNVQITGTAGNATNGLGINLLSSSSIGGIDQVTLIADRMSLAAGAICLRA